jgi:hypothetical protein
MRNETFSAVPLGQSFVLGHGFSHADQLVERAALAAADFVLLRPRDFNSWTCSGAKAQSLRNAFGMSEGMP